MSESDRLSDQLLDLVVYAPIGLALEAKALLPKLADRGRGQVALTRLAGKVAADRGQSEVRTAIEQVLGVVGSALGGLDPSRASTDTDTTITEDPRNDLVGDDSVLAIDDYDSLSAPQLLPHLPPLSDDELAQILDYEEAHRSRATVINRIRQLQD